MDNSLILLLKDLNSYDIISDTDASELVKKMKKNKVLALHGASVTVPKGESQRWQTYVKDDEGKNKKISAYTEENLYEKLYDYYFVNVVPTMKQYYKIWIEHRESENLSHKTILRYHNYWNKYYLTDPIVNKT